MLGSGPVLGWPGVSPTGPDSDAGSCGVGAGRPAPLSRRVGRAVSAKATARRSMGRFSYLKTLPKGECAVMVACAATTECFGNEAITKTFTKTNWQSCSSFGWAGSSTKAWRGTH